MPRYIDADALLKAMNTWDKFGFSHSGAFVREPKNNDYVPYVHYDDMVKCVEGMPTADVVEVVRCKDCKYWDTSWKTRAEFHYYCPMIDSVTGGDFYCADGERKDDE